MNVPLLVQTEWLKEVRKRAETEMDDPSLTLRIIDACIDTVNCVVAQVEKTIMDFDLDIDAEEDVEGVYAGGGDDNPQDEYIVEVSRVLMFMAAKEGGEIRLTADDLGDFNPVGKAVEIVHNDEGVTVRVITLSKTPPFLN